MAEPPGQRRAHDYPYCTVNNRRLFMHILPEFLRSGVARTKHSDARKDELHRDLQSTLAFWLRRRCSKSASLTLGSKLLILYVAARWTERT